MEIKVGCCGFPRGMKNYIKRFEIAEVQQTFYKPPSLVTVRKWREDAPQNFEFTTKAWQLITHSPKSPTYRKAKIAIDEDKKNRYGLFRPTREVFDAWNETLGICEALRAKLVVFQCPASFKPLKENIMNIKIFFSTIESAGLSIAWEPRGEWPEDVIRDLCNSFKLIHCVDPFKGSPVTTGTAYFRLHGSPPGKKMYSYRYSRKDLEMLAEKCSGFDEVYCMFNNMFMYDNALEFMEMIWD